MSRRAALLAAVGAAAARALDVKRNLREYRGHVVVLNFWATWCDPCRDEMPMLVAAEKDYRARGVVFIAASLDDDKTRVRVPAFARRFGIDFPVWQGATADDLARLRLGDAVPATAFIDPQGHIAARISGEMRPAELRERVEWLLGGCRGPAPPTFVSHVPGSRSR